MSQRYLDNSHEWASKRGFKEPTYMRHVQHLEDRFADRLIRSVRERTEQLHMLITKGAAKSLREITSESNAQMPQDDTQAKKVERNRPDSAIGQMLIKGASLEEVSNWIAKRTIGRWVRVLRPFASGPGLAVLISRLVHEGFTMVQFGSSSPDGGSSPSRQSMEIIPDPQEYLGAAIRLLTPMPDSVLAEAWVLVENLEGVVNLETAFNAKPDHPLRPNSTSTPQLRTSSSTSSRPHSVGSSLRTMSRSPKGCSGQLRRSGAFPWSDFQMDNGFRQTTMSDTSHKQLRKYPGPDTYGDVGAQFSAPQYATWGRFPRAGGRRSIQALQLSTKSRYFDAEHVIAS